VLLAAVIVAQATGQQSFPPYPDSATTFR